MTQRPEQSVMQALESLNDGQSSIPASVTINPSQTTSAAPNTSRANSPSSPSSSSSSSSSPSSSASATLHHQHNLSHHHHYHHHSMGCGSPSSPPPPYLTTPPHYHHHHHRPTPGSPSTPNSPSSSSSSGSNTSSPSGLGLDGDLPVRGCPHRGEETDPRASLDTKALAEASRTLNPALQDRQGRPKRDISTIIHILNDLLCATPQYRRHSTNISLSTSTPTTSRNKSSSGSIRRGTQQMGGASTSGLQSHDSVTYSGGGKSADNAQTAEQDSGDENQAMRTKVEQLRLIMEQRRARRKARRDARTRPYPHTAASWATDTSVPTVVATSSTATSATQAMDVDGSKPDGTDPTTLCELNSETVVA
ncbi:Midnolin-B-like [Homarus americanus]|uniref:Midnolin-B-like n=1 Tax=Homarus americanus TaxID=6706 RepID=A0A8J5JB06_HOMAM|nr:Midnolin-B-like [Homarus americanus]